MISFDTDGHCFNLRAVAVILSGDHVLLHRLDGDEYWSLPGGRIEAGEDAASAVVREMHEELAIPVTIGPLLWVVENFFASGAQRYHEVGLYFEAAVPPGAPILDLDARHIGDEQGRRLEFAWFDRQALADIDVRPAFLRDALAQEPLQFAHVVNRDATHVAHGGA